jgi:hypothetical protein
MSHNRVLCCFCVCAEAGEFPQAFVIAERCASHKLSEVHLQYAMALEDGNRFQEYVSFSSFLFLFLLYSALFFDVLFAARVTLQSRGRVRQSQEAERGY